MNDTDTLLQLLGNLTSSGILVVIVVAFLKGWVIPTPIQTKIDLLRVDFDANRIAQSALHEEELKSLQKRLTNLEEQYLTDMLALQEKRITDLEQQLVEREERVKQGMRMLASYTETQDRFSTLAELVRDKS